MAEREQLREIKCPHCGWIRKVPVGEIVEEGSATVEQGILEGIGRKIGEMRSNPALEEANAWIDMVPCPHCKNVYQYNVVTRETRP